MAMIIAQQRPHQRIDEEVDDIRVSLVDNQQARLPLSPSKELLRSLSQLEVEDIIDRENRKATEYTSLKSLIEYTRSDSFGLPRPPLKDRIMEKAVTVYLRSSTWSDDGQSDCFPCQVLRSVWAFIGNFFRTRCLETMPLYDPDSS